jgi:ubiquinone/menaquinone biosynthesis C-methylase UbiE
MVEYIHGEIDSKEIERLEHMAPFAADFIFKHFKCHSGMRMLDLGCGIGAMTHQLFNRFPGIFLNGVDIQLQSLRVAQARHPIALYTHADGAFLPFCDKFFDCVHSSWLLEHVRSPLNILYEVRRVLKIGGQCQFLEVDNSSFKTKPEYPEVVEVMSTLNQIQVESGGDPYIGRRLGQLLKEADFSNVKVIPLNLRGDSSNFYVFQGLIEVFANIFESVEQTLGLKMVPKIHTAAAKIRGLQVAKGDAIFYSPVIGRGTRNR